MRESDRRVRTAWLQITKLGCQMIADHREFKQNVDVSQIKSIYDFYQITYAKHDRQSYVDANKYFHPRFDDLEKYYFSIKDDPNKVKLFIDNLELLVKSLRRYDDVTSEGYSYQRREKKYRTEHWSKTLSDGEGTNRHCSGNYSVPYYTTETYYGSYRDELSGGIQNHAKKVEKFAHRITNIHRLHQSENYSISTLTFEFETLNSLLQQHEKEKISLGYFNQAIKLIKHKDTLSLICLSKHDSSTLKNTRRLRLNNKQLDSLFDAIFAIPLELDEQKESKEETRNLNRIIKLTQLMMLGEKTPDLNKQLLEYCFRQNKFDGLIETIQKAGNHSDLKEILGNLNDGRGNGLLHYCCSMKQLNVKVLESLINYLGYDKLLEQNSKGFAPIDMLRTRKMAEGYLPLICQNEKMKEAFFSPKDNTLPVGEWKLHDEDIISFEDKMIDSKSLNNKNYGFFKLQGRDIPIHTAINNTKGNGLDHLRKVINNLNALSFDENNSCKRSPIQDVLRTASKNNKDDSFTLACKTGEEKRIDLVASHYHPADLANSFTRHKDGLKKLSSFSATRSIVNQNCILFLLYNYFMTNAKKTDKLHLSKLDCFYEFLKAIKSGSTALSEFKVSQFKKNTFYSSNNFFDLMTAAKAVGLDDLQKQTELLPLPGNYKGLSNKC